jgi:hypothetical protein
LKIDRPALPSRIANSELTLRPSAAISGSECATDIG